MTSQRPSFCFLGPFHDSDENYPLRGNSFQVNVLLVGFEPLRGQFEFEFEMALRTIFSVTERCLSFAKGYPFVNQKDL